MFASLAAKDRLNRHDVAVGSCYLSTAADLIVSILLGCCRSVVWEKDFRKFDVVLLADDRLSRLDNWCVDGRVIVLNCVDHFICSIRIVWHWRVTPLIVEQRSCRIVSFLADQIACPLWLCNVACLLELDGRRWEELISTVFLISLPRWKSVHHEAPSVSWSPVTHWAVSITHLRWLEHLIKWSNSRL